MTRPILHQGPETGVRSRLSDQDSVEITFNKLCNPASTDTNQLNSCTDIPTGDYLGFVYLSGYDEAGGNFIKTIDLGNIHVEPAIP